MLFDPFAPMTTERKRFNAELKEELSQKQKGKCMYCGDKPRLDLMDIDHKTPLSRGVAITFGICNYSVVLATNGRATRQTESSGECTRPQVSLRRRLYPPKSSLEKPSTTRARPLPLPEPSGRPKRERQTLTTSDSSSVLSRDQG